MVSTTWKAVFFVKGVSSSRYELRFDFRLCAYDVFPWHDSEKMSKMSIFSRCFRVSDMMGKYSVCFMTLDSLIILANLCSYLAWISQISQPFFSEGDGFLDVCVVLVFATLFFWLFFSICSRKDVEDDFISLTIFDLQLWWGDEVFGSCAWLIGFSGKPVFLSRMIFYVLHSQYRSQWWLFWRLEKLIFQRGRVRRDMSYALIFLPVLMMFYCDMNVNRYRKWVFFQIWWGNFRLFHDAWLLDYSGKPVLLSPMIFTDFTAVFFSRGMVFSMFVWCFDLWLCSSDCFLDMFLKRCRKWFDISSYFRDAFLVGGSSFWFTPLGSLVYLTYLFFISHDFLRFTKPVFTTWKAVFVVKGVSSSWYELRFDFPLCAHDVFLWHESEKMSKMSIFSRCFRVSDMMGNILVCFMTLDSLVSLANLCSYLAWIWQISQPFFPDGDGFLDVCVVLFFATVFLWLFFPICFRKDVVDDFTSLTIFVLQFWWGMKFLVHAARLIGFSGKPVFFCFAWFFTFCIASILLNGDCFDDLKSRFCCKGGEFVEIWVTLLFISLYSWCFTVTWIWKYVENEYIL